MQRSLSMDLTFRRAEDNDLWRIVDLLGEDTLRGVQGRVRRHRLRSPPAARRCRTGGEVVGTLQLSFIQYLTYTGGERAQIEAVRVAPSLRGRGGGRRMIEWAIGKAQAEGCHLVQLTTDRRRSEARRFYESTGPRQPRRHETSPLEPVEGPRHTPLTLLYG